MKDVQVVYKWSDLHSYDSSHDVQHLIDRAVERILNRIRQSYSGDGPPRIFVEHCQEGSDRGESKSDLRYLKVYAEGQERCIVMAY